MCILQSYEQPVHGTDHGKDTKGNYERTPTANKERTAVLHGNGLQVFSRLFHERDQRS